MLWCHRDPPEGAIYICLPQRWLLPCELFEASDQRHDIVGPVVVQLLCLLAAWIDAAGRLVVDSSDLDTAVRLYMFMFVPVLYVALSLSLSLALALLL